MSKKVEKKQNHNGLNYLHYSSLVCYLRNLKKGEWEMKGSNFIEAKGETKDKKQHQRLLSLENVLSSKINGGGGVLISMEGDNQLT